MKPLENSGKPSRAQFLGRAHLDIGAPETPTGVAGARVCDPQRVASRTNAEVSFPVILAIHALRPTEPRSGAVRGCTRLVLPFVLALLTLVLTGCPRDEYQVRLQPQGSHIERTLTFYSADGSNAKGVPNYGAFDTNELALIAAWYPGRGLTNANGRHEAQGEFTNALPDDVGGAGTYTNLSTSLGEAGFYGERFRGSDDLAGIMERRLQAANQAADLVLGWSRTTLRREPGYDRLRHFLDRDFRRDLQNLSVYWWQGEFANAYRTNSDEEFIARFGQYLLERKYFTTGEFPSLLSSLSGNHSQPLLRHIQRMVARNLGVPDTEPVPASLAFLGDEAAMEKSFDNYLATTDLYRARLRQWKQDRKLKPDLKQPQPEEVAADSFQNLIDFDLFGHTPDHLTVGLSLPAAPLHSDGRWDGSLRQVVWDTDIGGREDTNALSFFCYANWVQPDEAFQTKHFGKTALTGDHLTEYCVWRSSLAAQHGDEWDAFLTTLEPGTGLTNRLDSFRFTDEPPSVGTNAQSTVPSPSASARELLKAALK